MEPRPPLPGLGQFAVDRTRHRAGRGDRPVSCAGLPEAAEAEIVASPLGRARRTAEIIAECLGRPRRCVRRSAARDFARLMGRAATATRSQHARPGLFDGDGRHEWYFRTPDGETYDGFAGRIGAWLAEPATAVDRCQPRRRHPGIARALCRIAARLGAEPAGAAGPHLPPRRRSDRGNRQPVMMLPVAA